MNVRERSGERNIRPSRNIFNNQPFRGNSLRNDNETFDNHNIHWLTRDAHCLRPRLWRFWQWLMWWYECSSILCVDRNRWNPLNTLLWLRTYVSAIFNVGDRANSLDCYWLGCTSCKGGCRTAVTCDECITNCVNANRSKSDCETFCRTKSPDCWT